MSIDRWLNTSIGGESWKPYDTSKASIMIKCTRCGCEWKDEQVSKFDAVVNARLEQGRGCPLCMGLTDRQADRIRPEEHATGIRSAVKQEAPRGKPSTLALAGLGSAIVGLFVLPIVFSSVGIILGIAAGENRGGTGWGAILAGAGGLAYYLYQVVSIQAQLERLFG